MSGVGLGFAVEAMVTILLAVTVGYCIMLDKRLRRFRSDEKGMRQTVVDLALTTERAEHAIAGLRSTLEEADGSLSQRLRAAEAFTAELDAQIKSGDHVLSRIAKIVASSRQAADATVSTDAPVVNIAQSAEESRTNRLADMLASARAMADRSRNQNARQQTAA